MLVFKNDQRQVHAIFHFLRSAIVYLRLVQASVFSLVLRSDPLDLRILRKVHGHIRIKCKHVRLGTRLCITRPAFIRLSSITRPA